MELTDAMVEAALSAHFLMLAEQDRRAGRFVPKDPTPNGLSSAARRDAEEAMRDAIQAALATQEK